MSSFLCFICHSTINSPTSEDTREKYRDLIGMNLCPDSHLCHICRHILNKLWLFKSICVKRSSEYPVLFSEKVAINLRISDTVHHIIGPKSESCENEQDMYNFTSYHYGYDNQNIHNNDIVDNHYIDLQDDRLYDDCYGNPDSFAYDDFNIIQENNDIKEALHTHNEDNHNVDNHNEDNHNEDNHNEDNHNEDNHNEDNHNEQDMIKTEIENVDNENGHTSNDERNDEVIKLKDKRSKKRKSKKQKKNVLSIEEQKAVLDSMRKEKKYLEAEFKCYNCALGFLFKDTYQAHMMRHEESNGEYQCEVCTLRFACASLLRAHSRVHTQERCKRKLKVNTEGAQAPCHLCGRIFMDSTSLKQHLKRFHNQKNNNRSYSCSVCGKSYSNQRAVRTHMIKHINKKFDCDKCSATFSSPYTLNQHKKKHDVTNETQYYCDTCNVSYNSRKSLLAHKRNTFAHQQTVFICPVCNKLCPTKRSLESHLSTVHASTKDYCCNICECQYTNRKSLVRHMATHDNTKNQDVFICYKCPKTFKSRSMLSRHLKKVCEKEKLIVEENAYYPQENI